MASASAPSNWCSGPPAAAGPATQRPRPRPAARAPRPAASRRRLPVGAPAPPASARRWAPRRRMRWRTTWLAVPPPRFIVLHESPPPPAAPRSRFRVLHVPPPPTVPHVAPHIATFSHPPSLVSADLSLGYLLIPPPPICLRGPCTALISSPPQQQQQFPNRSLTCPYPVAVSTAQETTHSSTLSTVCRRDFFLSCTCCVAVLLRCPPLPAPACIRVRCDSSCPDTVCLLHTASSCCLITVIAGLVPEPERERATRAIRTLRAVAARRGASSPTTSAQCLILLGFVPVSSNRLADHSPPSAPTPIPEGDWVVAEPGPLRLISNSDG